MLKSFYQTLIVDVCHVPYIQLRALTHHTLRVERSRASHSSQCINVHVQSKSEQGQLRRSSVLLAHRLHHLKCLWCFVFTDFLFYKCNLRAFMNSFKDFQDLALWILLLGVFHPSTRAGQLNIGQANLFKPCLRERYVIVVELSPGPKAIDPLGIGEQDLPSNTCYFLERSSKKVRSSITTASTQDDNSLSNFGLLERTIWMAFRSKHAIIAFIDQSQKMRIICFTSGSHSCCSELM